MRRSVVARGLRGAPLVAMEDREADQIGLRVGDRLRFRIFGEPVEATRAAIYGQRRFQSRFWLGAVFSDGVLDPFITRYVGAAFMDDTNGFEAQERIAATMPNVVTVHATSSLDEATSLLGKASAGLAVVAGVTLLASLLMLASVMADARVRHVYDATVRHVLGARIAVIRTGLWLEYALLVTNFALALGAESPAPSWRCAWSSRAALPGAWALPWHSPSPPPVSVSARAGCCRSCGCRRRCCSARADCQPE